MVAYYNENDPYAAQWLRNLIAADLICNGVVDERSIIDVTAEDLTGYEQCHFFAGIGIWSLALRRGGWDDRRPVWTGSCPCQPFSSAGRAVGFSDDRHLWPVWFNLIKKCRPVTVFGEQVATRSALAWLDLVHTDLESSQYTVGAVDTCAAGFGATHLRNRIYWVAHADADCFRLEEDTHEIELRKPQDSIPSNMGCSDEWSKPRPIGAFPMEMGNGDSSAVGRLRAYGNSLVVPQAEGFIRAYLSSTKN